MQTITQKQIDELKSKNHAVYIYPKKKIVVVDGYKRFAYLSQHENGIYEIEIKNENGLVESAATCATTNEAHKWAYDHKAIDIKLI